MGRGYTLPLFFVSINHINMKKILLNILTHGDESIGKRIADEIAHRYPSLIGKNLDIQVANEQAHMKGKRYIDDDLNRVFPGNPIGSYEERRAFELVPIISLYELTIDVHATESGSGDMVIVTKLDKQTKNLLDYLQPKYVLYMNMPPDKALISVAKIGIAFEMGSNGDEKTYIKTLAGIESLLSYLKLIPVKPSLGFKTQYFEVFEPVPKSAGARLTKGIENFKCIHEGDVFAQTVDGTSVAAKEDFYPVIFGSMNYETIFGFAARPLTFND